MSFKKFGSSVEYFRKYEILIQQYELENITLQSTANLKHWKLHFSETPPSKGGGLQLGWAKTGLSGKV
jgi:hypothetical protein